MQVDEFGMSDGWICIVKNYHSPKYKSYLEKAVSLTVIQGTHSLRDYLFYWMDKMPHEIYNGDNIGPLYG